MKNQAAWNENSTKRLKLPSDISPYRALMMLARCNPSAIKLGDQLEEVRRGR